jgi:hypothetical protein
VKGFWVFIHCSAVDKTQYALSLCLLEKNKMLQKKLKSSPKIWATSGIKKLPIVSKLPVGEISPNLGVYVMITIFDNFWQKMGVFLNFLHNLALF